MRDSTIEQTEVFRDMEKARRWLGLPEKESETDLGEQYTSSKIEFQFDVNNQEDSTPSQFGQAR